MQKSPWPPGGRNPVVTESLYQHQKLFYLSREKKPLFFCSHFAQFNSNYIWPEEEFQETNYLLLLV